MDITIYFHHSKNIIINHNIKWSHKIDRKLQSTVYVNDVAMIMCTHSNNTIIYLLVTLHSANAFAALNLPDTSTNLQWTVINIMYKASHKRVIISIQYSADTILKFLMSWIMEVYVKIWTYIMIWMLPRHG